MKNLLKDFILVKCETAVEFNKAKTTYRQLTRSFKCIIY